MAGELDQLKVIIIKSLGYDLQSPFNPEVLQVFVSINDEVIAVSYFYI